MQCEGITRAGRRCRNRALGDEIFCEIHLRVNRTYNLALLAPFLTILLLCYFFVFGLTFDTLVYGVFELNYLQYAGLSDFFISMFRTGGMLTVVVVKIWFSFSVLLAVLFSAVLLIHMIIQTSHRHLNPVRRLKIIGLSLGIFVLNFLHMFVFILPERNRKEPSHILIGREHLARSLKHKKQEATRPHQTKSRATAFKYYQLFLNFCSFRNHKFSATIFLLVLISVLSLYHASVRARDARVCLIDAIKNKQAPLLAPATLYPGLNMANLCNTSRETQRDDINILLSFARTLGEFFTFPVVQFDIPSKDKPLIYLGSTERFELFFNGETRLPFVVPAQSLPRLFSPSRATSITKNSDFAVLKKSVHENSTNLVSLSKRISANPTPGDLSLQKKIARIEEHANRSRKKLRQLELGLDKISYSLFNIESNSNKRSVASIPAECWNRKPHLILSFDVGAAKIKSVTSVEKIERLALIFSKSEHQLILISGFADPSGSYFENARLSHRRAMEVESLMLQMGLKETIFYSVGHGENYSTNLPRRRVEIRDCTRLLRRQIN